MKGPWISSCFSIINSGFCWVPDAALIESLATTLQKSNTKRLFLPSAIKIIGSQGRESVNEGTLSSFGSADQPFFILILRNIEERLAAEDKIDLLTTKTHYLQEELNQLTEQQGLIARDESMINVLNMIRQVAVTDSTVLIQGETGTGKELVAKGIHEASNRHDNPFIRINCGAIPANLIESELFGHEKGAFTGATSSRKGRFLLADKGTLFLDEIGELPIELQPKLLRVIQEGEFDPVGSNNTLKVNVRILAATHRDLPALCKEGTFREDLYYRLNVFPINVPPLRARGSDVCLIAEEMIKRHAAKFNKKPFKLSANDRKLFMDYNWPGNVRELQNIIERALIVSSGEKIDWEQMLPRNKQKRKPEESQTESILTNDQLEELEKENLLRALRKTKWKVSGKNGAAELLGIPPTTLASKIKAFGLSRPV
ncbi:MAG: sigma-54 dependent transcriptional regulator [Cyclobacteriaceae bacterium]